MIVVDKPTTGDDDVVMMVGDAVPLLVGVWSGASLNPESVDNKNCHSQKQNHFYHRQWLGKFWCSFAVTN